MLSPFLDNFIAFFLKFLTSFAKALIDAFTCLTSAPANLNIFLPRALSSPASSLSAPLMSFQADFRVPLALYIPKNIVIIKKITPIPIITDAIVPTSGGNCIPDSVISVPNNNIKLPRSIIPTLIINNPETAPNLCSSSATKPYNNRMDNITAIIKNANSIKKKYANGINLITNNVIRIAKPASAELLVNVSSNTLLFFKAVYMIIKTNILDMTKR